MSDRPEGSVEPLLELSDVHAAYGETRVLHGIDLHVDRGKVVALVGRNGAGKTTTLRTITGAVAPTSGTITYDGENVSGFTPTETARAGVSLVPEDRRIFPGLTVRENLAIAELGGAADARRRSIDDVLGMFENLAEREHNPGAALSGGEQQMLAVARALVAGGDLLLLDEPTEGLAPTIVRRVAEVIADLNDEGTTVLLVEQNVEVAMELADRVYVLDRGEIVYEGTPAELRANEDVMARHLGVTT
jgi:branched-chain amino acid transport system ATP-binding protein